ncbi:Pao retrotransposon peptidase family protein, partial [Aphelenchoides avenae]
AATLLAKLVIQEVWKLELDWDDDVPEPLALLWAEAIKDFDKTIIRIPRRIARSKISSVEIHVFTDGSSQAYGFTAYLRVKENDGSYSTNLVYSRAKVKPIKDGEKYTIPRMELLGVLVGARAAKFLYQEVSVDITAVYLWSDSTIVLHQVADTEKIKEVFVENRLKEIRQIRDQLEIQFRHVPTDDNPADIVSRGIAAAELQHCSKWWFGASFLAYDERHWPKQPTSLGEGTHSVPSPNGGLELYGSDTFAALYNEVFTPPEHPLPPTTVSAYVIDALGQATHSVARPTKLPPISMLPSATEEKHPVWSRQVRITYYVVRFTAACLRRLRETIRQRSPVQAPRPFTSALGFDVTEHFKSTKPNLRDLQLTETIMLRKTQLRHPPSQADRRNLGIFEYQGLLYVKGRLGNMKLRPTALTPLYLPREAKETELIIMDYHRNNCHSGVTATLANIRMRYWFTRGRRTIQAAIIKNCFPCRREVLHPYASPPWPQLPASRVTRARPFLCTGLDFFVPCYLRTPQADGHFQVQKYYVAIFVCMTYRCVHLELCADLSTQEFLHALRRFGSRREYPERILSDNGQSFLTAREVIQQVHQATAPSRPHIRRNPVRKVVSARLSARRTPAHSASGLPSTTPPPLDSQRTPGSAHSANPGAARAATVPLLTPEEEQFIDFCQRHKIEWQTITELSPWKGAVYERLIGLIKHCLRRSIGRTKPTVVEFSSLLAEAEHTANSRPLSYIADSETDFFLVRPLDFLIHLLRDEALQTPLDPPVDAEADPNDPDFIAPGQNQLHGKIIKVLKRARLQADLFWTQFRDGFLAELRSRGVTSKRQQFGEPKIHPGDLVLVWEPNVPRCFWRFALVLEVLPCDDGAIRSARIRFSKTHQEHTRSLAHLYPIGNLPRVPAQCHTTSCADVYLSSVISDNPVTMGNGQSVFSAPTLYDDDMHVPDAPLPSTANTELRHSATLAHSAGAAESAAIAQTTTEGTPSPTPESSTPEAEPTISDSTTRTDNLQLPTQTDLQELANITATHALVDAGPRADQDDQGKKTVHTTTTRLGARGAFQNRASAALAHSAGAAAPSTSTTESRTQPATEQRSTDVWSEIASDNANTAKNSQAQTAGTAFRGRGAFKTVARTIKDPSRTVAAPQEPTPPTATTPAVATTEADPWSTPDNDPWGAATPIQPTPSDGATAQTKAPTAISAHSARMAARAQAAQAAPTRSVGAAARPTGNAARPTAQPSNIDLLPPAPTLDLTSLPPRPSLATIKREVLQFFSFEEGRAGPQGQRLAKVDDQTLASRPVRKAQDVGFWIQHQNRDHGTSHWDPIKVCNGRDENRSHFHQSIRVHRIIIQSTWNEYRFLAARQDLLYLLEKLVNLRIMCFGQMILIEYAVRLRGDHDRMGSIVQFIYDILRTTDFEGDVPRIINRYYRVMTRGLDHRKSLPSEDDLRNATIRWLCYCHKALLYFLTHLSGDICWNVEWLQSKDLDRDFRRAISDNILMKARTVFQDIRRTVYQQYILRRIRCLELGDSTYKWARLDHVIKAKEINETLNINTTTVGKTVIFAAREICESAFVKTMKKDDILLNWMPSSNRVDVLDYVRRFFPGSMTERVIFWFGQSYILNGNEDYGQLLAELSYHYTTHFGQIDQYVILPAYDRTHRQVWTSEVLCLYLMRGRVVPHAQVILHPYDLRLWQMDQPAAERGDDLEPWSNRHQSEQGHIYKFGAVEARKGNLRAYHRLDLWTWYMEDHQGELPPQELHQHCLLPTFRPRGEALATQLANFEQQATAATAAAHSATAAAQLVTAIASPIAAAAPPVAAAASAAPSSSPSTATVNQRPVADIVTEVLNCVLSGPVLQTIVVDATQQAVRQVSSELDAKLARIEEMLQRRAAQQPTATAEHRPQDSGGSA